jgi:hypothetical protein
MAALTFAAALAGFLLPFGELKAVTTRLRRGLGVT